MKKLLLIVSLFLSCTVFATPVPDSVFEKINQRLGFMKEVGLYKAVNHLPVEDVEREQLVIAKASKSAEQYGLNPDSIMDFFAAQISAAKAIQYRYRADLLNSPANHPPQDLAKEIRPFLLKLGNEINREIANFLKEGGVFQDQHLSYFEKVIEQDYLNTADKQQLFKTLQTIRLKP